MTAEEGSSGDHGPIKTDTIAAALGTRILLVEDDPDSQDLLRTLCEGRGAVVDTAADGFQGLRLLSERRHDVVLIDYHLPEMDGYALARLMRELARPEGQVRLVGITADRHGLASRRGADTLFDAILVKPLEPAALFATLDRLTMPEAPASAADPADAIWRRRGLAGRPRALFVPEPSAMEAEAVGQAFALVSCAAEAEVVLVGNEAGVSRLRGLRGGGPAALLPSVDLTGRLGAACDLSFQVGDPDSWSVLAWTFQGFARRRAALPPSLPTDPTMRLLALLFVVDRALPLDTAGVPDTVIYQTGQSEPARSASILSLAQSGLVACEPCRDGGIAVRISEAGCGLLRRRAAAAAQGPFPPEGEAGAMPGWRRPAVTEAAASVAADREGGIPFIDAARLYELRTLVGPEHVGRMRNRLAEQLDVALAADADLHTLSSQAHKLISTAGSLGFARLSQACRTLEEAIKTGADIPNSLARARRTAAQVLALCRAQGA